MNDLSEHFVGNQSAAMLLTKLLESPVVDPAPVYTQAEAGPQLAQTTNAILAEVIVTALNGLL